MHDDARGDELFHRVMLRAGRGHAGFRGDSPYLTWVMRIAAREAARLHSELVRRRPPEVELDGAPERGAPTPPSELGWLRVVDDASKAGVLRPDEANVVRRRMATPGIAWATIAAELGIAASTCAVLHSRAVHKLRTFLCTERPEMLGGRAALVTAFERTWAAQPSLLAPSEAEAFRTVVLEKRTGYRRRGWEANLRSACAAVIRNLDTTEPS